ncbi:hypothetical protein D3C73_352040 [compost metagenome]
MGKIKGYEFSGQTRADVPPEYDPKRTCVSKEARVHKPNCHHRDGRTALQHGGDQGAEHHPLQGCCRGCVQQLGQQRACPCVKGGLHNFHTKHKEGESECQWNNNFTKQQDESLLLLL